MAMCSPALRKRAAMGATQLAQVWLAAEGGHNLDEHAVCGCPLPRRAGACISRCAHVWACCPRLWFGPFSRRRARAACYFTAAVVLFSPLFSLSLLRHAYALRAPFCFRHVVLFVIIIHPFFSPFLDGLGQIVTCAADGQVRLTYLSRATSTLLGRHEGRAHRLAIEPGSPHRFMTCGEIDLFGLFATCFFFLFFFGFCRRRDFVS